jgi:hypothetical protein
MTEKNTPNLKRQAPTLFYIVSICMLLMAGFGILHGIKWYLNVILGAGGALVLLGIGRPVYRVAVYRPGEQEVLCRFIPWYQANTLLTSVMLPIGGVAGIAMGGKQAALPGYGTRVTSYW